MAVDVTVAAKNPPMTADWLAKMNVLTLQVSALTAEKDAWVSAPSVLMVSTARYPALGCRQYAGTQALSVVAEILVAVNADLAAAQLALTNLMTGK